MKRPAIQGARLLPARCRAHRVHWQARSCGPRRLLIDAVFTGSADATGEKFFDALVGHMSKALGVAYAFVSVFTDRESRMRYHSRESGMGKLHGAQIR